MLQEPLRTSLPPSYTAPSSTSDSHTVLYPSVLSQNRPSDHAYASPSSTTSRDRLRKKPPKHSNVAVGQRPAVRADSVPSNQVFFQGDGNSFSIPEVEMSVPVRQRMEEPVEFAGVWRGDEETAFWRPVVMMGRKEGVSRSLGSGDESYHGMTDDSDSEDVWVNGAVSQSMNPLINQSIKQSIHQSINPLINQSIKQSINQSIKQSINQSINPSINPSLTSPITSSRTQPLYPSLSPSASQSINQSTNQSINHSITHSINQSINQTTNQTTNQPTNQTPSLHSPSLRLRRQVSRAHLFLFFTSSSFLLLPATSPAIPRLHDPQTAAQLARRFLPLTSYDTPLFDSLQRGTLPREIETVEMLLLSHVDTR